MRACVRAGVGVCLRMLGRLQARARARARRALPLAPTCRAHNDAGACGDRRGDEGESGWRGLLFIGFYVGQLLG